MIVEGRSDDQTWTGIPLKNICKAATRACVVRCFAISLLNALSIFSPQFFPNSPFITLWISPPCCAFCWRITSSLAQFLIQSRNLNGADGVLPTSAKCGA